MDNEPLAEENDVLDLNGEKNCGESKDESDYGDICMKIDDSNCSN